MTTRETTLIDRDMLLDWLEDERDVCLQHDNYGEASEASYIQKHVMEMPKEDVKPVVHAHWVTLDPNQRTGKAYRFACSNCERVIFTTRQRSIDELGYAFCPHCGAKMEE